MFWKLVVFHSSVLTETQSFGSLWFTVWEQLHLGNQLRRCSHLMTDIKEFMKHSHFEKWNGEQGQQAESK